MHDHMYLSLPEKMRRIAYNLCMLRPGEHMHLDPRQFNVSTDTIQNYVTHINGLYGRQYRTMNGITRKAGKRVTRPAGTLLCVQLLRSDESDSVTT